VELSGYISRNAVVCAKAYIIDHSSRYEGKLSLLKNRPAGPLKEVVKRKEADQLDPRGYYENPWFYNIRQAIYMDDIRSFISDRLLFVDNTMPEDDYSNEKLFAKLSRMWKSLDNAVIVSLEGSAAEDFQTLAPGILRSHVVYEGDPMAKVLSFDANTLRLETSLDRPRFLLWVNGYHPGWHVYIDGHEGRLLRADYAFKGAWIPAGDHEVVFRFATPLRYAAAYVTLLAFVIILAWIVVLGLGEGLLVEKEVAFGD
jgi:hypothetical protein